LIQLLTTGWGDDVRHYRNLLSFSASNIELPEGLYTPPKEAIPFGMDHTRATAVLRQYVIVEDCLSEHRKLTSCATQAG
jgi:hypothetical protein